MMTYARLLAFLALFFHAVASYALDTTAPTAMVMDAQSREVLFEKNPDQRIYPGSLTKIMTVYMVFDRLKKGEIKLSDEFTVSEKAWRKGGSKMFIQVGTQVSVENLLRGAIVQSGNDATIALAEGLEGSEEAFSELMSLKAKEIGMENSHFMNVSGWPHDDHYTTTRDLATLALRIISDFPEYYPMFSETSFTYNKIKQPNRNRLLYRPQLGVDGIKTGHTEAAGYCIVTSGMREGRRVIAVVNGLKSSKERAQEAEKLLVYGYNNFANITPYKANESVAKAAITLGKAPHVDAVVKEDVLITVPRKWRNHVATEVELTPQLQAPVAKHAVIGTLLLHVGQGEEVQTHRIPLVAATEVAKVGWWGRTIHRVKGWVGL